MLGSMLENVLSSNPSLRVTCTARSAGSRAFEFDAERDNVAQLIERCDCDWVINAIGVLAGGIDEQDPASVASAISVNAVFPNTLASATTGGPRVLQIATDGVFSGLAGPYDEQSPEDALGVYALSKALGEVRAPHVFNLRCSIVGPERGRGRSLMAWALSQPRGATIDGWTNHLWNGVTTYHFARICEGLVQEDGPPQIPNTLHLVPEGAVTKASLLEMILETFGRHDVKVRAEDAPVAVDRRLSTRFQKGNAQVWSRAGFDKPPTHREMLHELLDWTRASG